ncbi:MAG TPA: 16S rRNA (guanine(527)-N(7))-methyltransferase RsmG [Aeromicrobium sp.]|nr:16S rRNA (guanine(527)-N(7))-methyltransferase RsmG [Aeromicrobium sp.]
MLVSRETPGATEYFGDDLARLNRYIDLLSTRGIERGLIGPREGPRLWDRHVLNCAVVVPRVPSAATVADVGSGAGLPGLVWAIARPDLRVTLIEPLLRRTAFLTEVIDELGLANATVVRARAAEVSEVFDVVTARAVADLGRLGNWCLPLVRPGGVLLAFKGESASTEVTMWTEALRRSGAMDIVVTSYGDFETPTTVVEVSR